MATNRAAWGVDIGNRALKAVKLVTDGEGLHIEDFEIIEHDQILSTAGDNKETLLQAALAGFVQRHQMGKTPVAIGVSGQSSFARFIKLPPVEARKIPEIVRFEAIQQIPFPLDDVEWSYQLFQEAESPEVEVGIFAMRKELVNRQIAYFTDLGMNVQAVQMSPLAVYNAMYADERIDGTTMFMDCGAENTDLIISDGETVWLRTLPIGGNTFTEVLAKSFKLNFAKAEELKRNSATSKYARQIFQAMRPVFVDLHGEIQRSIGFYASVHRDARIKRIVALGGTFRLPGLQKYLQQNLQLDVARLDAFKASAPADPKMAALLSENVVSMPAAYGLALQGLGQSKISSSLLPERIRRTKMWREKVKYFALAASLFVAGTGGVAGRLYFDNMKFDAAKTTRDKITAVRNQAENLSKQYAAVQTQGETDRNKIIEVRELQKYRNMWASIIRDVHNTLPNRNQPSKLADIMKTPRGQRQLVYLDSIRTDYRPDIGTLVEKDASGSFRVKDEDFGKGLGPALINPTDQPPEFSDGPPGSRDTRFGPSRGPDPVAAAPTAKRGYLLTIHGTSPRDYRNSAGHELISKTLIAGLAGVSEDKAYADGKPYYVARLNLVQFGQRRFAAVPAGPAAGGFRPDLGPAGGGTAAAADPKINRLTGESMETDTEFTLVVAIVLDPTPPKTTDVRPVGN